MYNYSAKVIRVVDGDTMDVLVDLGFCVHFRVRLRLSGIDCPETHGAVAVPEGLTAMQFTKDKVEGKQVILKTHKQEKYGRYLAEVFIPDDKGNLKIEGKLNDMLVQANLARPYFGAKK
jgi:micrococcal nuclease